MKIILINVYAGCVTKMKLRAWEYLTLNFWSKIFTLLYIFRLYWSLASHPYKFLVKTPNFKKINHFVYLPTKFDNNGYSRSKFSFLHLRTVYRKRDG